MKLFRTYKPGQSVKSRFYSSNNSNDTNNSFNHRDHPIRSKELKDYLSKLTITSTQEEVIIGILLGSGALTTSRMRENTTKKVNLRIQLSRKFDSHLAELFEILDPLCRSLLTPYERIRSRAKSQSTTVEKLIDLRTYALKILVFYHDKFYIYDEETKKYRKAIPSDIKEYLTPRALGIMFCQHGSRHLRGFSLKLNKYPINECEILLNALNEVYNLDARLELISKHHYIIIPTKSSSKFINIVKPYVSECCLNKLI